MDINVTIIQSSLAWEDKQKNLSVFSALIGSVKENTDLIVLPEMFTTGFSMRTSDFAEPMNGESVSWMKEQAEGKNCVITGSIIIKENDHFYNRLVWASPDGSVRYYDKRHLFSIANENKHYSKGYEKLIADLNGWKAFPMICYDLRFPVWSRYRNDYDILIYVANWPEVRRDAWKILLQARAVENLAYVIGVNRIGSDKSGQKFAGDSAVFSPLGVQILKTQEYSESVETITLSEIELNQVRKKFPFYSDADKFEIIP